MSLVGAPEWFFAGGAKRELEFVEQRDVAFAASNQTIPNVSFGNPSVKRTVIVGATSEDNSQSDRFHNSLVWGGITFERQSQFTLSPGSISMTASIWSATVPAGVASGDMVWGLTTQLDSFSVGVWAATGLKSPTAIGATGAGATLERFVFTPVIPITSTAFMFGVVAASDHTLPFTRVDGDDLGENRFGERLDIDVRGDHRMGLYNRTGDNEGDTSRFRASAANDSQVFAFAVALFD